MSVCQTRTTCVIFHQYGYLTMANWPSSSQRKNIDSAWPILDALDLHIAVVDRGGVIIHTNSAWDDFARENPLEDGSAPPRVGVGVNYLSICHAAEGTSAESALAAYRGIQEVLDGKKRQFILEYPCHSPTEQRWFVMKVTPLKGARPKQVAIVHTNVTALKLAEFEVHHKAEELTQTLENLERFAGQLKSALTLKRSVRSAEQQPAPRKNRVEEAERLKLLSEREQEVLLALVRGERNADIARRLSLSTKSVSTYRSRVMEKLNVKTTAELVTFVTRIGVL